MQLSVGSRWIDTKGCEFVIDSVSENGVETWVEYCRVNDKTFYRCLAEAFTYRFKELKQ